MALSETIRGLRTMQVVSTIDGMRRLRWQTNWIVYLVSMPAGFVLFAIAWLRVMRMQRPASP